MIDRATIQRVMDAVDIVDVVKEFVTLRKAGANYKGLCPFHNERTPSFSVSPARQMFKCFSCGKGGSAVTFLMELEQMTYPEAIKWLGNKYGIEVKDAELTDKEREEQSLRESMFILNDWACEFFQHTLHHNVEGVAKGLAYFRSRGFRDDIIAKFKLGFAPEKRDALSTDAISHGFNEDFLLKTGLCFKTDDGKLVDRYRGRVIFPVQSVSGRVVAFGGRILGSDKKLAKYVNSPESEIYSKSNELYGLYQARSAIGKRGFCFLVEGYTDVISMHQSGVENVVASSGTSLTTGQIRLLHRFTKNITILYDGDAAGIKASLRGIDMLLAEDLNIKVLLLPDGDDPDSFARKHPNAEEFQVYIDQHQVDFIKFKTNLLKDDAEGDPLKRAELITNIVQSISVIPNEVVRQEYVRECAILFSVGEEVIVNEMNRLHRAKRLADEKKNSGETASKEPERPQPANALTFNKELAEERLLISAVIRYGELPVDIEENIDETEENDGANAASRAAERVHTMSVANFIASDLEADGLALRSPIHAQILKEAVAQIAANDTWEALPYFIHHPDPKVSALAAELGEDSFVLSTRQREQYTEERYRLNEVVPRLLHDFKHSIVKERLQQLLAQLRDPSIQRHPEEANALLQEYMELTDIERQFAQVLGDRVLLK